MIAATALGAAIMVVGVLVGAALAGGRCSRCGQACDPDDDDGGDEIEPAPESRAGLIKVRVPRQDAPGAQTPDKPGSN